MESCPHAAMFGARVCLLRGSERQGSCAAASTPGGRPRASARGAPGLIWAVGVRGSGVAQLSCRDFSPSYTLTAAHSCQLPPYPAITAALSSQPLPYPANRRPIRNGLWFVDHRPCIMGWGLACAPDAPDLFQSKGVRVGGFSQQ